MKVLISPAADTSWKLDPQQLLTALLTRYPLVQVIDVSETSEAHCLEWTWLASNGPVDGSLDGARNTVALDGDIDDCAEFAVWFRGLVPETQELVFYDESYSANAMLGSTTTAKELITP